MRSGARDSALAATVRGAGVSLATERLNKVIEEELCAKRPCPDLLAHLFTLRGADDATINQSLDELDGEDE